MLQLSRKQSQVRLSTLLVMDEIFRRSHCFRCLLLSQESFDCFLRLIGMSCAGSSFKAPDRSRGRGRGSPAAADDEDDESRLPPPAEARKQLKRTAIQLLDK